MKIIDKYIRANGGNREELLNSFCVEDKVPSAKVYCNEDCENCWNQEYKKQEIVMLQPSKINPNYLMHTLVKYQCMECEKEFIVSEYQAKGEDINCPYCSSDDVEEMVYMDNKEQLEELGCMGIAHSAIVV